MLAQFRTFAKSPAAAVLLVLLIASFAVFGIRDVFKGKAVSSSVITAGSRTVSQADYKREFDGYKSRVEQESRQEIPLDVAVANGLDKQVMNGVAAREAFSEFLTKIGVRPSDNLVAMEIQKNPGFFDPLTGKFDKTGFERKLAENNLTPLRFDALIRDQLAQQQAVAGLAAGLRAPRAYTALAAIYGLENRDVGYFAVEPSSVPAPPAPTDAQLIAFMKSIASQITRPEFRTVTVVRFSPAQVGANLPVDPAELKKRFDFRKDTLSTPETRTVIQIPVRNPAAAQQVGQALAKGQDPAAVAKAAGVEAVVYSNKPETAIADRKVAKAAFALAPGQVAPVQGDLGPAIIKVVTATPGHPVTLEDVRPQLEAEIRKDAAKQKTYDLTQVYEDAHEAGSNLAQAAQKAGVAPVTLPPLSKEGRDLQGQPVPGLSQKLVDTAFGLPAGGESEIVEEGNGDYFAVRVEKITPPAMIPLEEIRPKVVAAVTNAEIMKRMQARADELAARVKKGESLDAVAASAGQKVVHVTGVDRQTAGQNTQVSQDLLGKAFGAKPGEVFTAENTHFGLVVGKLEVVRPGDVAVQAQMAEQMRQPMSQALFREIGETAQVAARKFVKVQVNPAMARSALGLPPLETTDAAKPGLAK